MRTVEIGDAKRPLSDYAKQAHEEPVLVTRRGKPYVVVARAERLDLEDLAVSTNPEFITMMERSRRRWKPWTGIPLEEIRRRLGDWLRDVLDAHMKRAAD
jgi:prevent-host-death family protein